jgi:hypothetical protein
LLAAGAAALVGFLTAWWLYAGLDEARIASALRARGARASTEPALFGLAQVVSQVDLSGVPFDGEVAGLLNKCRSIEWLCLDNTGVTDHDLSQLRSFSNLSFVSLRGEPIRDGGGFLVRLPRLDVLMASRSGLTARGAGMLCAIPTLRGLDISYTAANDDSIRMVAPGSLLKELNLVGTKVTDAGAKWLAKVAKLDSLALRREDIVCPHQAP